MNDQIIQSLWVKGELSNNELLGLRSYIAHGHKVHLYTYNEIRNLPDGIQIEDANKIILSKELFRDSENSLAAFSDWFRFKLLYEKGGWWVDIDTVCLQPIVAEDEYCFSSEYDFYGNILLNATVIKTPPKAPFLKDCLDQIDGVAKNRVLYGEFGLKLYRSILEDYEYLNFLKSPIAFCPINWFNISELIAEHTFLFNKNIYTIHLWNEMWRRGYLNKNATYHPKSLYEKLKSKYLV